MASGGQLLISSATEKEGRANYNSPSPVSLALKKRISTFYTFAMKGAQWAEVRISMQPPGAKNEDNSQTRVERYKLNKIKFENPIYVEVEFGAVTPRRVLIRGWAKLAEISFRFIRVLLKYTVKADMTWI